jgi:hypothetical protein
VGQEQLTLSGHLSLSPVFSGAFVDRCLSFRPFSFGHYTVYPSSIYGFDYPFGIFKLFFFPIISNMLSSILSNLDFKYLFLVFTEKFEDTKRVIKAVNRRRIDSVMAKRKRAKRQATIYKSPTKNR